MAKFDFIKQKQIISYIEPKVFWSVNNGMTVGKSASELFRFRIANFKRYFATRTLQEIYHYGNNIFLILGVYFGYKVYQNHHFTKDALFNGSPVGGFFSAQQYKDQGYEYKPYDSKAVKINNQLQ